MSMLIIANPSLWMTNRPRNSCGQDQADIMNPLLIAAEVFSRSCSHNTQTWTIKAFAYQAK